jgi:hypothetical protein
MKTRNLITGIAFCLFFLFTLVSCEKDPSTLLTDGIWTFENLTTDSQDENVQTLVALGKALLTDATMEFQADGTYIITSPLMNEPTTGTWSLIGDDQLVMDPDDELPSTGNIETLTKDQLTYMETFTDLDTDPYTISTTWVRE